ncbi:hypothetical protein ACXPWS_09300 [Mycobacterium sp. BMJ-28]
MREFLNSDTLFNTIAMLRSGTDGLILVVEGSDDRHVIERHVHHSVTVLCGQGGKQELVEAAALVDARQVSKVRVLIDRDYDNHSGPVEPYADCIVASTNHDLVMDLLLVDLAIIYRVIDAHTRGPAVMPRVRAADVFAEALIIAARVSTLRMLSLKNRWDLNLANFPFGRFSGSRPNPQAVVRLALERSKPGPKPTPVLKQLRSELKANADRLVKVVGDHDFFGAVAFVLRRSGYAGIGESSLAASFFAAVDCSSVSKTDWFNDIEAWSTGVENAPCFVCPCDYAA